MLRSSGAVRAALRRLTWLSGAVALAGPGATLRAQSALSVHRCRTLPAATERIAACRDVVRDADRDPDAHLYLARALLAADRNDEALAAFQRAARLAPKSPEARHGTGVTLLRLGRQDDAARELAEAARLAPHDAYVLFDLGGALQRLGRREEAFAVFATAARTQPGHASSWGALGLTAAQLGRHREAIAFWERARLLDPTYFRGASRGGSSLEGDSRCSRPPTRCGYHLLAAVVNGRSSRIGVRPIQSNGSGDSQIQAFHTIRDAA